MRVNENRSGRATAPDLFQHFAIGHLREPVPAIFLRCGHSEHADAAQAIDHAARNRDLYREIAEAHAEYCPIRFVPPRESADTASPNPPRTDPGKVLSQTRAPAAPQKAVPQPAEFLSVFARRVYSFNYSRATNSSRARSRVQ